MYVFTHLLIYFVDSIMGYKEHKMLKPTIIGMVLQYCEGGDLQKKIVEAKDCQTPFPESTVSDTHIYIHTHAHICTYIHTYLHNTCHFLSLL